jgi:hypothetical protein
VVGQGGHPQSVGGPAPPPEIRLTFAARLGTGLLGISAQLSGNETVRTAPEPSALGLLIAGVVGLGALALLRPR